MDGAPVLSLSRSAERTGDGLTALVRPEQPELSDPLSARSGPSSAIQFRTDTLKQIMLVEIGPGPEQTAYGLLADLISILREGQPPRAARERGRRFP